MTADIRLFAILPVLGIPAAVGAASVVTGGHLDAPAFGYETSSGFEPHIHNEGGASGAIIDGVVQTTESEFEPDEVAIRLRTGVVTNLGGTAYFWLPEGEGEASANSVPFLGIGLEELNPGDWIGQTVSISLQGITGPGEFRLWQDDGFGGAVDFINTAVSNTSFDLAAGTHSHFNWGFTEEGTYGLDFAISGEHVSDGSQSASATYTFVVPEPSTAVLGLLSCALLLRRHRS